MLVQFFRLNPHIAPFLLAFFVGWICLLLAPIIHQLRTKKIIVFDIGDYNQLEKKLLLWGVVLAFGGILCTGIITEVYGYKYTYTDINGIVTIVNSKGN